MLLSVGAEHIGLLSDAPDFVGFGRNGSVSSERAECVFRVKFLLPTAQRFADFDKLLV